MQKQNSKTFPAVLCGILAGVFLLLFLVSGTIAVYQWTGSMKSKEYSRELVESYSTKPETDGLENGQDLPFRIDLAAVQKENPDTAGWLYVPCLDLSLPVLYSGDNSFYLYHDFRKEFSFSGSLFLDMYSNPDFSGGNTVIYGHHMDDGFMFGTLWKIPYQKVAMEDLSFWIITSGEALRYQIFSAFESNLYSEGFKQYEAGTKELCDWAHRMKSESFIPSSLDTFRPSDKVVTLTTCGRTSFERILVMGRLEERIPIKSSSDDFMPKQAINSGDQGYSEAVPYQEILRDKTLYMILAAFLLIVFLLVSCLLRKKKHKTGGHKRESE